MNYQNILKFASRNSQLLIIVAALLMFAYALGSNFSVLSDVVRKGPEAAFAAPCGINEGCPPAPPTTCVDEFVRNECIACGRSRSVVKNSCTGEEKESSQQDDVLCDASHRPEICPQPPAPTPECKDEFVRNECIACGRSRSVVKNSCTGEEKESSQQDDVLCDASHRPEICPQPPTPPGPPAPPAAPQACFVCDGGSFRATSSENCAGKSACDPNNPDQGACTGASAGQACGPRVQQPAQQQTAQAPAQQQQQQSDQRNTCPSGTTFQGFNGSSVVCVNNTAQAQGGNASANAQGGNVTLVGVGSNNGNQNGNSNGIGNGGPGNDGRGGNAGNVNIGTPTVITAPPSVVARPAEFVCPSNTEKRVEGNTVFCLPFCPAGFSRAISGTTVTCTPPATTTVVQAAAPVVVTPAEVKQPVVVTQAQVAADKLPATGLPLIAWAVVGLAPFGFKLRRFGRSLKDQTSANSIWEDRQFRK